MTATFGESSSSGRYDVRAITATSNACYFEMLDWQADRSDVKQQISMDKERPDITGLYDGVLATFWINNFEKLLTRLEEKNNVRLGETTDRR